MTSTSCFSYAHRRGWLAMAVAVAVVVASLAVAPWSRAQEDVAGQAPAVPTALPNDDTQPVQMLDTLMITGAPEWLMVAMQQALSDGGWTLPQRKQEPLGWFQVLGLRFDRVGRGDGDRANHWLLKIRVDGAIPAAAAKSDDFSDVVMATVARVLQQQLVDIQAAVEGPERKDRSERIDQLKQDLDSQTKQLEELDAIYRKLVEATGQQQATSDALDRMTAEVTERTVRFVELQARRDALNQVKEELEKLRETATEKRQMNQRPGVDAIRQQLEELVSVRERQVSIARDAAASGTGLPQSVDQAQAQLIEAKLTLARFDAEEVQPSAEVTRIDQRLADLTGELESTVVEFLTTEQVLRDLEQKLASLRAEADQSRDAAAQLPAINERKSAIENRRFQIQNELQSLLAQQAPSQPIRVLRVTRPATETP